MKKKCLVKIDIEYQKNELKKFCEKKGDLYLYGSGYWGGKLVELIGSWGYQVNGFVVTQFNGRKEYCNLPIIEARTIISHSVEKEDIKILMAFENPDMSYYRDFFPKERFHLYSIAPNIMGELVNEQGYAHLIDVLNKENNATKCSFNNSNSSNILIIRLDVIGDLVCSTATIREIRFNYPEANITLVINSKLIGLFEDCPYIDELLGYDCRTDGDGLYEKLEGVDEDAERVRKFIYQNNLQEKGFDLAIIPRALMTGSSCIEELMMAVFCNCRERIGHIIDMHSSEFEEKQYILLKDYFTLLLLQKNECHETDYQLDMLEKSGLKVSSHRNELWVNEESLYEAKKLLDEYSINKESTLVALGVVGSKEVKNWDKRFFCEFIKKVKNQFDDKYCFLILGGADAVDVAKYIVGETNNCVDFTGKTNIKISTALIKCCELYVGIDTGLMHIADALGKPSIALYHSLPDRHGVTSYGPVRWGARTKHSIIIEPNKGIDGCSMYCRKEYAHCINTVTSDTVFSEFKKLIAELKKDTSIV